MDFFRKYQRPILLVAAVFALITFSITGDMLSTFETMFRAKAPAATIEVAGKELELSVEDRRAARAATTRSLVVAMPALPSIDPGETRNATERLAVVRRAALASGLGGSYDEVDAAIAAVAKSRDLEPSDLAASFASLDQFRATIFEAMRIGTYVRLQALPLEPFDVELAEAAAAEDEEDLVTARYLKVDEKAIEEEFVAALDAKGDGKNAFLQTWLTNWVDDLEDGQARLATRFQDPDRLRLDVFAIEAKAFDPTQWTAELEGVEITDAQIEQFYAANKSTMFVTEAEPKDPEDAGSDNSDPKDGDDKDGDDKDGKAKDKDGDEKTEDGENQDGEGESEAPQYRELDDELRAEIRNRLLATAALENVSSKMQLSLYESLASFIDARTADLVALSDVRTARDDAKTAVAADEDDEALQEALEAAEQAFEEAEAKQKAADDVVSAQRKMFDAAAAFDAAVAGRAGVTRMLFPAAGEDMKPAADLRELAPLGTWFAHNTAARMSYAGQFSPAVSGTESHVLTFRVADLQDAPLKSFEDEEFLETVQDHYLATLARERADEEKEKLEEIVERLGRAARSEEIAKIETSKAEKLETQVREWREGLEKDLADAQARLESVGQNRRARAAVEARIADVQAQLTTESEHRETLLGALDLETENEIADAITEAHPEILDAVAAEAGLEIQTIGPQRRRQVQRGSTKHIDPDKLFFFFRSRLLGLEVGDSLGIVSDPGARAVYLGVVTEIKKASPADIPRSRFLEFARQNRDRRSDEALRQSFSMDALKKRLKYVEPGEEEIVAASGDDTK